MRISKGKRGERFYCSFISILISLVIFLTSTQGFARPWKQKPYLQAQEYLRIVDQRYEGKPNMIWIMWIAWPMLQPNLPNIDVWKVVLDNHIVILVGDFHEKDGNLIGQQIAFPPKLRTFANIPMPTMNEKEINPAVLAKIHQIVEWLKRALGTMGQGLHLFFYDGANIAACEKGGFWVKFAGTDYDYETPIPGCNRSQ